MMNPGGVRNIIYVNSRRYRNLTQRDGNDTMSCATMRPNALTTLGASRAEGASDGDAPNPLLAVTEES